MTLSIADSEAVATADGKILIANTNDSALSGVGINTTAVTDDGISVSPSGNAGEWTVTGATSVSQLQSAIQQLKVVGPEDYAGAMKVTVSARAAESGVDASPYASGNFTVNLSAVAEAPTLTVSNITDAVEDTNYSLNGKVGSLATGGDASEAIVSVIVQGLNFTANSISYSASIVDSSGNSVGIPDGSGGVTLTKAQYDAGVYIKPPADFYGTISNLSVSAVARDVGEDGSGNATATTIVENISMSIAPRADDATLFDLVDKNIAEYVNGTAYEPQSLGLGIVIPEQDSSLAEVFSLEVWLPQKNSVYATLTKSTEITEGGSVTAYEPSSRTETVDGVTYKIVTVPQSDLSSIGDVRILPSSWFYWNWE